MSFRVSFSVFFDEPPVISSLEPADRYYLALAWFESKDDSTFYPPVLHSIWGNDSVDYLGVEAGKWQSVTTRPFIVPPSTQFSIVFIAHHNDFCQENQRAIRIDSIRTTWSKFFDLGKPCRDFALFETFRSG